MSKKQVEYPQRVILYGRTVILGTVAASLQKDPNFEIILPADPYPSVQQLGEMAPDVILFDLENARPTAAFALLSTCPGLQLIGIDPDRDHVLLWTGEQLRELSSQGLIEVIHKKMNEKPTNYHAYLLRIWRTETRGQSQWRASMESPHTGENQSFASLEQCLVYLREQFEGKEINHNEHQAHEAPQSPKDE